MDDALRAACESGIRGHGSSSRYTPERVTHHYVDFNNGHIERISERENLLIGAAYQQGREHERISHG